jgi:hypothetical protein
LSSDPFTGPFTTSINVTLGTTISIRLNQITAGPVSNVNISFGDGTPVQNYTLMAGSFINMTKNYTAVGTFKIVPTPVALLLNVTLKVNNFTVVVNSPTVYQGKF